VHFCFVFLYLSAYHIVILAVACILRIGIFVVCSTSTELAYYGYLEKDKDLYILMSFGGILFEDIPQFIIQITYAVQTQKLASFQIASFSFTIYRLIYSIAKKCFEAKEKHQPVDLMHKAKPDGPGLEIKMVDVTVESQRRRVENDYTLIVNVDTNTTCTDVVDVELSLRK
jgi:hypothetical protein